MPPTTSVPPHDCRLELEVHLLGTPWVGSGGTALHLTPSAASTLALLAMAPDDGLSRTRMASQLFADCPEPVARRRLSTALWRLGPGARGSGGREAVGPGGP